MKTNKLVIAVLILLFAGSATAQKTEWKFDKAHTKIQFVATHMKISEVTGQFKQFTGKILSDKEDFSDTDVQVSIQVKSIDTDNDKRDKHLVGEDFFNASRYPEIRFESESLTEIGEDDYKLKGQLTIKDVTRTVTFDVDYKGTVTAMGATRAGFKLSTSIDRFDYNVDWDKSFGKGLIVGREVELKADVELIQQK